MTEADKLYVAHAERLTEILQTKTDKEVSIEYSTWSGTPSIWIEKERVAEFCKPKYKYGGVPYITVRCGWYGERTTTYKMLKNGTFSYPKIAEEMVERYNQYVSAKKAQEKTSFNYNQSCKLQESLRESLGIRYKIQATNYADKVEFQIRKEFTAERLTEFVALLRANGFADLLDY
jgi:Holliday junction resolvase